MCNPDIPKNLNRQDFCCDDLFEFLLEGKLALAYSDQFRELQMFNKHYQWVQTLHFCPWCGQKRPASLHDEWIKRIEEGGVEISEDGEVPSPYNSDKWWKDACL